MAKSYVNIDLPPGIRSNGTEYSNRGHWIDGDRIRWANRAVRPIGGWERFDVEGTWLPRLFDDLTETARTLMAWRSNTGAALYAVGTNKKLYAFGRSDPTVHDITPEDFAPRERGPNSASGYGNWYYGTAAYGTERPYDADIATAFSWGMRPWGENLLAAPRGTPSKLYMWDTAFVNKAVPVANSPLNFDCFHVTDQRIVMTAGADGDPRIIKWSDSENLESWQPLPLNKAGFQLLPGIGRFRDIVTLQDRYILVSETDVYVARYIGAPFVFSFDQLGRDCGCPSPNSIVATNDFVMWPGHNSFFICDGNSVNRIECDVMDKFARSLNRVHASKTIGFVNPFWPEIWWLYQANDDDVDSYVYYNWLEQFWGHGTLSRTAAGGYMTAGGLTMVDRLGRVYSHERDGVLPVNDNDSEIFIQSGPIELASGNKVQYIKNIQPDFEGLGVVNVSLIGVDRPGGPETVFGPYSISYPASGRQPVPVRARGHAVKMRVQGVDGAWSMGSVRLDFGMGGER